MLPTTGREALITMRDRDGDRTFLARIGAVERKGDGWYFGFTPIGPGAWKHGAWGYATLHDQTKDYGVQKVQVL